jgi:hypothetical protein
VAEAAAASLGTSRQRLPGRLLAAGSVRAYHSGMDVSHLPGGDLIASGLDDLGRGVESVPALLVSIGAPKLRQLGYAVPRTIPEPEQRLYALLARDRPAAAHSRYNAMIRRLVSFERAAACVR